MRRVTTLEKFLFLLLALVPLLSFFFIPLFMNARKEGWDKVWNDAMVYTFFVMPILLGLGLALWPSLFEWLANLLGYQVRYNE